MKLIEDIEYHLEKLKNVFEYTIFIYKNNICMEYDWSYIYKFIEFKLRRMKEHFKQAPYEGNIKDCIDIAKLIILIEYYWKYEAYEDLPNNPTSEDFERHNKNQEETWKEIHEVLCEKVRHWWY